MSKPISSVDVIAQDVTHLQRVVNDITRQLDKMQKQAFFDTADADNYMKQSFGELLEVVAGNTKAVSSLMVSKKTEQQEAQEFYNTRKRLDSGKRTEHYKRLLYLASLKQRVGVQCSCKKHKSIQFVDNGTVVETMCPVAWWVSQSYLALKAGKLAEFNKSTPLDKYERPYKL